MDIISTLNFIYLHVCLCTRMFFKLKWPTPVNPTRVMIQNYDGTGAFNRLCNRLWTEFEYGFNDSNGNFWFGNDMISNLTLSANCTRLTFELQVNNWPWAFTKIFTFTLCTKTKIHNPWLSVVITIIMMIQKCDVCRLTGNRSLRTFYSIWRLR